VLEERAIRELVGGTTGAPPAPALPAGLASGEDLCPGQPEAGTGPAPVGAPRRPSGSPGWAERGRRASALFWSWPHADLVLVAALMAVGLGLRWRTMSTSYWGDEAIAIGIAAHPIGSLPHYLVDDGSPPLYYVALHYWMQIFGRSEEATHALSMVAALLAVPAAWWSGNRLFGRWAARGAAGLVATCAYLDYYSTETRMYSWVALVAIVALTCFVLACQGAGRRYWVAAAALVVTLMYLQYYGLYLLAATTLVAAATAWRRRDRRLLRSAALYAAVCAAGFAPWAPQFVYQVLNTGAPWSPRPTVIDLIGDTFNGVASAGWPGITVTVAVGAWAAWQGHRAVRAAGTALRGPTNLALAWAVALVVIGLAWAAGQVVNSWAARYLGIAIVPALVPLAGALARARRGLLGLLTGMVAMTATAVPLLVDRAVTVETAKSDVAYLLAELRPALHRGALVISSQVTNMPVVALDLGPGYRYATPLGLLRDPIVVNWSDLPTRLQGINATSTLGPLLASVPVGGQVLLINPTVWGGPESPARYIGPVKAEGVAANQVVLADPELVPKLTENVPRYSNPLYPMTATLFVKVSGHRTSRPAGGATTGGHAVAAPSTPAG
jgi:mannosyltransferase